MKSQIIKQARGKIYRGPDGEVSEKVPLNNKSKFPNVNNSNEFQLENYDEKPGGAPNRDESNLNKRASNSSLDKSGNRRSNSATRGQQRASNNNEVQQQNRYYNEEDENRVVEYNDENGVETVRHSEKFPIPDSTPILYTTTTTHHGRTLDINTRIRLTQV